MALGIMSDETEGLKREKLNVRERLMGAVEAVFQRGEAGLGSQVQVEGQ